MTARHSAVAALALLALACAAPPDLPAPPADPVPACDEGPAGVEKVTIQYLRAGGFVIRFGNEALLTAPFYTNPGFVRVGLGLDFETDRERIPTRPEVLDGATVAGVLVGHAHYDHLMDVPAVLDMWNLEGVPVFGDRTAKALLRNDGFEGDAFSVGSAGGSREQVGEWIYPPWEPGSPLPPDAPNPRFRVMPLLSEHAPHFLGIKLFGSHVQEGAPKPLDAYDWKEGHTWAYLIDVLADDGERVLLRIHYQDSASSPEIGLPHDSLLKTRPVDLALFCAASFSQVDQHPEVMLEKLAPRHAMAGHWEDFSRDPRDDEVRVVPATDLGDLLARMRTALENKPTSFSFPQPGKQGHPGQQIRFSVCAP